MCTYHCKKFFRVKTKKDPHECFTTCDFFLARPFTSHYTEWRLETMITGVFVRERGGGKIIIIIIIIVVVVVVIVFVVKLFS